MIRFDGTTGPGADVSQLTGDLVLQPFVCADGAEAEGQLAALVTECVAPVVRRVVRHHMSGRGTSRQAPEELEDIEGEAVTNVLGRLRDLRSGFNGEPIANFSGYVATVASNACYRWIRSRRPNRARLKNRLRYLFSHDPGLALWQEASGEWLCGASTQRGGRVSPDVDSRLRQLADDHAALRNAASSTGTPSEAELARTIVRRMNGAVAL